MTVRIAHLSDIHVDDFTDLRLRDMVGKRFTGWVNHRRNRSHEYDAAVLWGAVARIVDEQPDLAVVSGDLTNLGLASELRAARTILQPLADAGIPLRVVPGNHDYYVRSSTLGTFEEVFREWQQADARLGEAYPFVARVDDVACLFFNSGVPTPPIMAFGRVGPEQLDRGRRLAAAERDAGRGLVFVVHHHPTRAPHRRVEWTRGLRDAAAFRRLAASSGAHLVLHGHNHYEHFRRLAEHPDTTVCGISSGTTTRRSPAARVGQIGLYELDASGVSRLGVSDWDGVDRFGQWRWVTPDEVPVESARERLD